MVVFKPIQLPRELHPAARGGALPLRLLATGRLWPVAPLIPALLPRQIAGALRRAQEAVCAKPADPVGGADCNALFGLPSGCISGDPPSEGGAWL